MRQCLFCGKILVIKEGRGYKKRKFCSKSCQNKNRYYNGKYKEREKELLKEFGEFKVEIGCNYCGYNKCPGSLGFHHLRDKKTRIHYHNFKSKKGKAELKKCILLCSNCHGELHYNK